MASNLVAMASNLMDGLQPRRDGLQPSSDGLQPSSDGLPLHHLKIWWCLAIPPISCPLRVTFLAQSSPLALSSVPLHQFLIKAYPGVVKLLEFFSAEHSEVHARTQREWRWPPT